MPQAAFDPERTLAGTAIQRVVLVSERASGYGGGCRMFQHVGTHDDLDEKGRPPP
jgi:hypothetical protein